MSERTDGLERAVNAERTVQPERADDVERIESAERAVQGKRTAPTERAVELERTDRPERAAERERTEAHERALAEGIREDAREVAEGRSQHRRYECRGCGSSMRWSGIDGYCDACVYGVKE